MMANIAEGFERGETKELLYFLSLAKGSAGEVRAQLYVAHDQGYLSADEFKSMKLVAKSTSELIYGFMNYLKETKIRGHRYHETYSVKR